MPSFPRTRMRRNRASSFIRAVVAEKRVTDADLILPLFLADGAQSTPVASMPGVFRNTIDDALRVAEQAAALGIPALALFPEVDASLKTPDCAESWREDNLINRAVGRLKQAFPDLGLITDVALDPYNPQGHDGYLVGDRIVNDELSGGYKNIQNGRRRRLIAIAVVVGLIPDDAQLLGQPCPLLFAQGVL